jgi:hypothetical protein
MKIDDEAISEILVADTNSESGVEASNLEDELVGGTTRTTTIKTTAAAAATTASLSRSSQYGGSIQCRR